MTDLDEVLSLFQQWGSHNYDEDLAQAEHALQTAAHAEAAGVDEPMVAAALLHDVGHLLALDGRAPEAGHEDSGAAFLTAVFPPTITRPIALHVAAKRYLCAVDAGYERALSAGSTRSLRRQGGPMSPDEITVFEATPGCQDAVALRRWDDAGKADTASARTIESYRPLLARVQLPLP
jgi:phosphonate degradation associated HDIG domain protein